MTDQFSLEGRTAIVTGGSRGIGYAIAEEFIARGARVIITARGEKQLQEAAASLGANAIARRCDNANLDDIKSLMADAWAIAPIDILVNNAGISPYYKRVEQVTLEDWQPVMDVNLRGLFFCSNAYAEQCFAANRGGAIVNISSMGGIMALDRLSVYSAAKAGIHSVTRSMAWEWAARGIRVNAIAPGWTATDFTEGLFQSRFGEQLRADIPMGRLAEPEDITGAAVFLASDAARYITGTVLPVEGGRLLR
jgi:NAD(P)-dependent dehydrogenase (short-subunit alcohol dehydrogenase family)